MDIAGIAWAVFPILVLAKVNMIRYDVHDLLNELYLHLARSGSAFVIGYSVQLL
jgi:hypothetical protein